MSERTVIGGAATLQEANQKKERENLQVERLKVEKEKEECVKGEKIQSLNAECVLLSHFFVTLVASRAFFKF